MFLAYSRTEVGGAVDCELSRIVFSERDEYTGEHFITYKYVQKTFWKEVDIFVSYTFIPSHSHISV